MIIREHTPLDRRGNKIPNAVTIYYLQETLRPDSPFRPGQVLCASASLRRVEEVKRRLSRSWGNR
jgi:hypothetical protein